MAQPVHRLAGEHRGAQRHATLIEYDPAQLTTRCWYAFDAVAWVEAHEWALPVRSARIRRRHRRPR
ncbi:hypothetical protein [Actinocatenispora rupis]|uniref:hypothetical protein n=1 Tax=Actinocatenispora rupis TaxID=519421 RepID=UPI0019432195|nr:hypothetical protein [Actinocatenispora rupis]